MSNFSIDILLRDALYHKNLIGYTSFHEASSLNSIVRGLESDYKRRIPWEEFFM